MVRGPRLPVRTRPRGLLPRRDDITETHRGVSERARAGWSPRKPWRKSAVGKPISPRWTSFGQPKRIASSRRRRHEFHPTHQRFLQLVHPEDRDAVDRAFQNSRHLDAPQMIEHRIVMPDGRIKFVEERWQVVFDEQGRPVRVTGTCQDITERKQAEETLRLRDRAIQAVSQGILDHRPESAGQPRSSSPATASSG